jgi:FG-GAP-like repeat
MPLKWTRKQISSETFESAGVFDVDGDGILDIVCGGFWYKGPDFSKVYNIATDMPRYADYYDDFSTIAMDINGDGRLDFITGGWWGENLRWRENPGEAGKLWPEHVIVDKIGNVETTRAWDIDGDGRLEIVPNTPNTPLIALKLITDAHGKGTGKFSKHQLFSTPIGHGYGFGDIDGDGKGEFVFRKGILKAQGDPLKNEWKHLEEFDLGHWDVSCPVIVADVNGDGLADLIVGHAHNYGLDWWEQGRDASGKRTWTRHPIDPFNAQYHDLIWADIDGDGQPELITGKRHRAHCGNDPGEQDDLGLYYFKWTGAGFAKQVIAYGPLGVGAGCGIHFQLADLRGTGRLDIVAPGKDGLFLFLNEGP